MNIFWPRRGYLTYSSDYAAVTYDPAVYYKGSSIRVPEPGPSSCIWIVPYKWCSKDDCPCYLPECAEHGCMERS